MQRLHRLQRAAIHLSGESINAYACRATVLASQTDHVRPNRRGNSARAFVIPRFNLYYYWPNKSNSRASREFRGRHAEPRARATGNRHIARQLLAFPRVSPPRIPPAFPPTSRKLLIANRSSDPTVIPSQLCPPFPRHLFRIFYLRLSRFLHGFANHRFPWFFPRG